MMSNSIRKVYGHERSEFAAFAVTGLAKAENRHQVRSVALRNLLDLVKIFEACSIDYVLFYGTLLGAVREGELIPHDTDIDVAVILQDETVMIKALGELEGIGLRVLRVSGPKDGPTELVSVGRGGEYIDISLIRFRKVLGATFVGQRSEWIRAGSFLPLTTLNLAGTPYSVPRESEKLLRRWYGRGWKAPQIGVRANHHRRIRNFLRAARYYLGSW